MSFSVFSMRPSRSAANRFGRRILSIALGAALVLAAGGWPQPAAAATRVFTLDPSHSSLKITGYVTSSAVTLSAQTAGSDTASYSGSVDTSIDATGITFPGGSSVSANNFSGSTLTPDNPANYGLDAKVIFLGNVAEATVINLKFDVTSPDVTISPGGTFAVSSLTASALSGTFDYNSSLTTPPTGTVNVAGDTAANQSTGSGSLTLSGQTQTLTIPVKATITFTVSNTDDSQATLTGQFVATTTIPTPPIAYWTGNVDGNWNTVNPAATATNWATDATGATDADFYPGATSDVFFTTSNHGAHLSTTLGANFSIKGLTFTSAATNSVTIGGTNTLTLGVDGLTMQSGAAAATINAAVTLGAAQTWTVNGANPLTIGGSLDTAGHALTKAGSGTVVVSGAPNLAAGTALAVNAGTLEFQVTSSGAVLGSGVTATVASGAQLELAGTVSALSSGARPARIS